MQLNILDIAQKLIDELLVEEQKNRHRAEGVALLFQKLQQAHAAALQAETAVEAEESQSDGQQ